MAEPSALRERLLALRADALQQVANADHPGAGLLVTLADAETVLAALDRDGSTIWLTVYTEAGAVVPLTLTPMHSMMFPPPIHRGT